MKELESEYLFALCNAWSEKALKSEIESMHLRWRLSYQQRGFVTFKPAADASRFSFPSLDEPIACARRLCLSLGRASSREEAVQLALAAAGSAEEAGRLVFHHVRLTDGWLELDQEGQTGNPPPPLPGQRVVTVVGIGPAEFWTGLHVHTVLTSPDPAGCAFLALPAEAPSRAWLKFEEAVRFFGLEFSPRDVAVEVGCAPGGVVFALLQRGISVIGVDPAKLDPVVMPLAHPAPPQSAEAKPWLYHCRKPAALVSKKDLDAPVTWFLSDMNQSPSVALAECARFIKMCPSIESALITLKLTDLVEVAEKSAWFERLRPMGFKTWRLQQLHPHHKEFALLAQGRGTSGAAML